jgi:hypothetical protein
MNFELCRKDGNKKLPKAYLTSPRRPCYKYRLHYPLFKIHKLKNTDIKNSGFESGKKEWKSPGGERLKKEFINIVSDSFSGRKALKVSLLEEPSWGPTLLRGNVSSKVGYLKPGKYTLRFYAKGAKLDHMKVSLGRQGPVILRHGNLPAEKCWTKYEIPFDLPSEQNNGRIYMEFFSNRRDRDAYAVLDGFEIIKN